MKIIDINLTLSPQVKVHYRRSAATIRTRARETERKWFKQFLLKMAYPILDSTVAKAPRLCMPLCFSFLVISNRSPKRRSNSREINSQYCATPLILNKEKRVENYVYLPVNFGLWQILITWEISLYLHNSLDSVLAGQLCGITRLTTKPLIVIVRYYGMICWQLLRDLGSCAKAQTCANG